MYEERMMKYVGVVQCLKKIGINEARVRVLLSATSAVLGTLVRSESHSQEL